MPKPRVSELSQRQAPKLRTSSSTSDSSHPNRLITTDRTSKLGVDRRSPRSGGPRSDPPGQKKLGGRISDLESQLGQAQEELRLLKEQLANAEAVKKQAQDELLHNVKPKKPNPPARVEGAASEADTIDRDEVPGDAQKETDVFEVPVEKIAVVQEEEDQRSGNGEAEKLVAKEDEIKMLKARLYDMEKEHESLGKENESLKSQLRDSASEMSNVKANEDEMASKVSRIGEELEESRAKTAHLKEKLESMEEARDALEAEMKKLRVQTEQWRKAADAAAAVLSGEMNGRDRTGSAEKCFAGGLFDPNAVVGFVEPQGMADDSDDGLGSGKRKSSGMKMFGELWKKRGQK